MGSAFNETISIKETPPIKTSSHGSGRRGAMETDGGLIEDRHTLKEKGIGEFE